MKDKYIFKIICPKAVEDVFKDCKSLSEVINKLESLDEYSYSYINQAKMSTTEHDIVNLNKTIKDVTDFGVNDVIEYAKMYHPEGLHIESVFIYKKNEYVSIEDTVVKNTNKYSPYQWIDGWTYTSDLTQEQILKLLNSYRMIANENLKGY